MTKLSPAAQAILDAVDNVPINVDWWPEGMPDLVAAVLRAVADQVVVKLAGLGQESAWYLEEIATELDEAQ